jgi:hypothetical protein
MLVVSDTERQYQLANLNESRRQFFVPTRHLFMTSWSRMWMNSSNCMDPLVSLSIFLNSSCMSKISAVVSFGNVFF